MTTLADLLKRQRAAAGITQEELAEKAEISARSVSDIERGLRVRIYKDTARRLAEALRLDGGGRVEFESAARGRKPDVSTRPSLAVPPTRLIGRERELEVILGALARPEVRLVTLTGPGGVGKTRLALEAAIRQPLSGSVRFVELGGVADSALVVPSIARAVGVSGATEPSIGSIADRVADDRVLLVLDTLEHVLGAAIDIASLLSACPGVTVLATSRESLRIRGEHEVTIATLDTPASATLSGVVAASATQLFIERAVAVQPGFTVDAQSAETIADICRRVNGLPLAVELAAARIKHMSLAELRDQLEHSLQVLVGGARDLPRRQQTMRATVDWSYRLLSEPEQEVFRNLCVFSGGWTIDAAQAVSPGDVLDNLSALVDKSLAWCAAGGETRYAMLDVVREFGMELPGAETSVGRHLDYFLALAEQAEPAIGTHLQAGWLARLQHEHDNIRSALRRAISGGDARHALRLSAAIWRFWMLEGHLSEGRYWLRGALALKGNVEQTLRSRALWGLAWLSYHQADYAETEQCALEMARGADPGNPVDQRNALTVEGIVDLAYGRYAHAIEVFERGVQILRGGEAGWLLATSLLNLGAATAHATDPHADGVIQEARDVYTAIGDERFAARAVFYLGQAALERKDVETALKRFHESLVAFWELDDPWGIAEAIEGMSATIAARGDSRLAATLAGGATSMREQIHNRPLPADRALLERHLAAARAKVEERTWQQASEKGRGMNIDELVELALAVTPR